MDTTHATHSNPFTPIFGKVPPYLAGRRQIIQDMGQAFDQGQDPNLSSIFVGARGTGKTALLSHLATEAEGRGWVAARVTAIPGMLDDIFQRAASSSAHLVDSEGGHRLAGIEISALGSVTWENPSIETPNWRSRMTALLEQLNEKGVGLLITVDEIDPSLDEMTQLATTYQHFIGEDRKVALLMAGLPHNVSQLLSGKSTSFLRRAFRHDLRALPSYEVRDAFRITVESGGRTIDDDALEVAVEAIDGFPFMFQLVGYRAWNASADGLTITAEDVERGAKLAREEISDQILAATYAELSSGDIAFLEAMLQDDELSMRDDLVARLGKGTSHVSTYKKRLLESGVIDEPQPGRFRFALPGLREYLQSQE